MTSSQLVKMRLELRRGVLVLAVLGLLKQATTVIRSANSCRKAVSILTKGLCIP
nr:hypothetical protein [Shewanella putrefaciens]